MAATTAVETKLDITRNRITASVPLYLQSDLHVNGTLGVIGTITTPSLSSGVPYH